MELEDCLKNLSDISKWMPFRLLDWGKIKLTKGSDMLNEYHIKKNVDNPTSSSVDVSCAYYEHLIFTPSWIYKIQISQTKITFYLVMFRKNCNR